MPDFRRAILAVLFCAFMVIQLRFAYGTLEVFLNPSIKNPELVNAVNLSLEVGPADLAILGEGAKVNDRVVAFNGQPVHDKHSLFLELMRAPMAPAQITLARGNERILLPYQLKPYPDLSFTGAVLPVTLNIIVPFLCIFLGFFVAWQRPYKPQAWILLLALLGMSQLVYSNGWTRLAWSNEFRAGALFLINLVNTAWPAAWLWFCVDFPNPSKVLFFRVLRVIFAIPALFLSLLNAASSAWIPARPVPWRAIYEALPNGLGSMVFVGAIFFSFASLFHRFFGETNPDQRRRLRLLLVGLNVGLSPLGGMVLWTFLTRKSLDDIPQAILIPGLLLFAVVPLTLAYVVLVERAFDVGVVLRQGLQYAVATRGVQTIRLLIVAALLFFAFRVGGDTTLDTPRRLLRFCIAVGAAFLLSRAFVPILAWVDRRFFREAVDSERLLSELHTNVVSIVDTRQVLETVANRIAEALHVPCVAALVPVNGHFVAAHSVGCSAEAKLPSDSVAVAHLGRGTQNMSLLRPSLPEPERAALETLGSELLLPLVHQDRLLGILSLGPKQSEEPYSHGDLRLLESVAVHTGLALENSRLTTAVAQEAAQRERIHREIEIAREVQERLLPREGPHVAGLDYAGHCRPALTIGGDYYDFLETPTGEIGFALGDIAGKGVPAALLMASLQASLRGLTAGGVGDLRELMAKLNRLVYDATPKNRFATFVYVLYESETGRLRLCSAGHNASLLVRNGTVEWIRPRGIALGLARQATYEQVEITLEPGDRLILYTDGITEARNGEGDEYGEARLAELALGLGEIPAAESLAAIVADVDRFAGETPQHDDLTALVLRCR
jgi:sigma-B regulation protein RsbU (phosphoserine phosphatase)